jgi:hypothetical protein
MSRREIPCHDRRYEGRVGWDAERGDYLYAMIDRASGECISQGEDYRTAYALARDTWGIFDWLSNTEIFRALGQDPIIEAMAADGDPRMAELVAKSQGLRLKAS